MAWLWWIGAALVLGVIETLTVDLTFLMLAGGAVGGAIAAALGTSFLVQAVVFAAAPDGRDNENGRDRRENQKEHSRFPLDELADRAGLRDRPEQKARRRIGVHHLDHGSAKLHASQIIPVGVGNNCQDEAEGADPRGECQPLATQGDAEKGPEILGVHRTVAS